MSTSETKADDLLDKLILEIKAIALLYGSEFELRERLDDRIVGSHDEDVRRFVKALQVGRHKATGRLLALALGELVMASALVVAGTIILAPTVVGVSTLASLVQYFAERTSGTVSTSPLSPYLSFVEFAIGILLMLSAFFALREAALNLRQAGLSIKPGET